MRAPRPTDARNGTAAVTIASIVTVCATVILHVQHLGYVPLVVFDYQMFHRIAINLIEHHAFSQELAAPYAATYFRSPGYPAFIALIYALSGASVFAVRAAQFVVLALTAWLLYRMALVFGRRVALISALICATYPPLLYMSAMYTTETLSTFLAVAASALTLLICRSSELRIGKAVFLGVVIGALSLVRPSFTLFFIVEVLAIAWGLRDVPKRAFQAALAIGAGFSLIMAPWLVRNRLVTGHFAGPSAGSGWSLYVSAQQWSGEISYGLLRSDWAPVLAEFNSRSEAAARAIPVPADAVRGSRPSYVAEREWYLDRHYADDARSRLLDIPPGVYLQRLLPRLYWLWSTSDVSPWGTGVPHRIIQAWHVILVALAVTGMWLSRRSLLHQHPFWLLAVYLTSLHLVYHVEARYTVPARPLIWCYAAVAIDHALRVVRSRDRLSST